MQAPALEKVAYLIRLLLRQGQQIDRFIGVQREDALVSAIEKALGGANLL